MTKRQLAEAIATIGAGKDSCASHGYAVQLLDAVDLSRLAVAQKALLKASEQLRIAIDSDLEPLLRECKTPEDVLAVKFAVREKIGCSLDGLMEVHFAIAYVGREAMIERDKFLQEE